MVSQTPARPRVSRRLHAGPATATRPPAPLPHPFIDPTEGTGRFHVDVRTASWSWSPELFRLLGLGADQTRPSLDALLRRVHPDDRERVLCRLDGALAAGRPFAVEARVLQHREGGLRVLVLSGEPRRDPHGSLVALDGTCVDVTAGRIADDEDVVNGLRAEVAQLHTAMASRAAIEQAKGILMLLTSCTEQVAFELLAHMSSHTHRKVRQVAQAITDSAAGRAPLPDDIRAILRDACPPSPRLT